MKRYLIIVGLVSLIASYSLCELGIYWGRTSQADKDAVQMARDKAAHELDTAKAVAEEKKRGELECIEHFSAAIGMQL